MAQGKDKTAIPLNCNIPEAIMAAFETVRVRRRLKKQEAIAQAMLMWAMQKPEIPSN